MNLRFTALSKTLLALAGIAGVACVDMSAPNGPASISVLLLPSPSVVVGDVMRDSNGVPAPLSVLAYDAAGNVIPGLTEQFFITDSVLAGHLGANNVVVGDKIGTLHLIGQIGALQTGAATVPVTSAPAKFVKSGTPPDTLTAPVGADSSTSLGSVPLAVSLRSAGDSAVAGFVVKYVLVSAPASLSASAPAVYLVGDAGKLSTADTTDASGLASRTLIVNSRLLGDQALITGAKVDSAVVRAFTSYKGVPVAGSPITFVVHVKVSLPF